MSLITPNHERLKIISEVVREELGQHESRGGKYYDEQAGKIAARAIHTCMPELAMMQQTRLIVEAENGLLLVDDDESVSQSDIHVEAKLERVSIQVAKSVIPGFDAPVEYSDYDLYAVLVPRYIDPNPQDIVFGQELYVPFSGIERFESAA